MTRKSLRYDRLVLTLLAAVLLASTVNPAIGQGRTSDNLSTRARPGELVPAGESATHPSSGQRSFSGGEPQGNDSTGEAQAPAAMQMAVSLSLVLSVLTSGLVVLGFVVWLPMKLRDLLKSVEIRNQEVVAKLDLVMAELQKLPLTAGEDLLRNDVIPELGDLRKEMVRLSFDRTEDGRGGVVQELCRELQVMLEQVHALLQQSHDFGGVLPEIRMALDRLEQNRQLASQELALLRKICETSRDNLSAVRGELNRHWSGQGAETILTEHYGKLLQVLEHNWKPASALGAQNRALATLETIRSHLLEIVRLHPNDLGDFVQSLLNELDPVLPKRPDFGDLKKKVESLGTMRCDRNYRQWRIRKDWELLCNRNTRNQFAVARLLRWDGKYAIAEGMEQWIRDEIVRAFPILDGKGSPAGAKDLMRSMRSKIVDLVARVDRFSTETTDSSALNDSLRKILDCLDLREMPIAIGTEEYSSSKHVPMTEDPESRYPRNTVVGVVRRGLIEKASGTVVHKAHVIVARRPQ